MVELSEVERSVLSEVDDGIHLWELQAALPAIARAELRAAVKDLLAAGCIELVPTGAGDPSLGADDIRRYLDDDPNWMNVVENPWPQRGTIHELITTQAGRMALA